jgi:hypothetical protein
MKNQREIRTCAALAVTRRGASIVPASGRCDAAAHDFGDVRVRGRLIEIPLCQDHFRKMRDSNDPTALVAAWSADLSTG